MADVEVPRDNSRLPWLEPYRAPPRKKSNRRAGVSAVLGAVGLAAVVTLLTRDMIPFPGQSPAPQASVVLPAPEDIQPQIVLPPLKRPEEAPQVDNEPARAVRSAPRPRRKLAAAPTRSAYREVVKHQSGETHGAVPQVSDAALAIAAVPIPPDPPRPMVNPAAQVVRGKTVQMGVYKSAWQAETAWRSAIRDYTFLVTMPKSIEPITIRSKRFYRLQLGTPSKKHARQLCGNLKSTGRACTVA